jgi:hypothetical protein
MNIEVLHTTLAVLPNPGLDTLDPRWAEVSGLVQAGQFSDAARASEALLRDQVHDIRLVGYLCFGHFLDEGPRALPEILRALLGMLDGNWEAIGPAPARAKMTQQSLSWLFKQVLKQLAHAESTEDEAWRGWTRGVAPEQMGEALDLAAQLQQAIGPRLEKAAAPVLEPLAKLQSWLRAFRETVAAQAEAARPPAPPPSAAPEPSAASDGNGHAHEAPDATPAGAPRGEPMIAGSYHLALLMRKIDALAELLDAGKVQSARIVADDVSDIVAHFDPYLYLPALFARFARLMARHARDMAEVEMDPDAPVARALRALYHVDLEAFLQLE